MPSQPLSLLRSEKTAEGNFSQDGEFESLSQPYKAPGSPKRSAMEPECKGGDTVSFSLNHRCWHTQDLCLWVLPSAQDPIGQGVRGTRSIWNYSILPASQTYICILITEI